LSGKRLSGKVTVRETSDNLQKSMHVMFSFEFSFRYAKTRTSDFLKVMRQHTESVVGSIISILLEIYLFFQQ